jgi:hypothetical protein
MTVSRVQPTQTRTRSATGRETERERRLRGRTDRSASAVVPVSLLPQIAEALAVSLEELIGKKDVQPAKRGPAPKLQQQIERIQRLPRAKQRFVIEMLDTVLAQASR